MPYASNGDVRIYWEVEGRGEPLLMIMGLGFSHEMWGTLRPALAGQFQVILFDNRGVGKSDVPPGPYTIPDMSRDAACVLDAAGVSSAHVFGVSMGGMVAQEFALLFPERVRKLVLGCTSCGGKEAFAADADVGAALFPANDLTMEQMFAAMVPYLYDPHTPQERIEQDMALGRENLPSRQGFMNQLMAILWWQSYARLPEIKASTLVLHGESDRLIPSANAAVLADRIPGARLVLLREAAHLFISDQPEISRSTIVEFLATPREARAA